MRIGFDMDGVLADFASAYYAIEDRLFPAEPHSRAGDPAEEARAEDARAEEARAAAAPAPPVSRHRRDAVWRAITATPDFWTTLRPTEEGVVRRIHEMSLRHRWEVFFITQRPSTAGDTVQRQTQRWLVEHGFDLPSVLVIHGSRGAAAGALRLDYHVDDTAQNCVDVKSQSPAKPLLIVENGDELTVAGARRLGIGTVRSISDGLAVLEEASINRAQPGLLDRLAQLVGWT
jgi:5' nucleotidase, deoxy (Pyrimidine), cytosolic type C protein (NT5C)